MADDLKVRPGKIKLASMLGMPPRPVKLYEKLETAAAVNAPLINPFRIIGGFGTHKFLFIFEIPPSGVFDLFNTSSKASAPLPAVYDFGTHIGVEYEFPMKFVLYRLGDSPSLHFRSILNNEKGVERVAPILRDIKNSTLSVSIIDETGKILQAEKLACCQRGSRGGLCFRIRDFVTLPSSTSLFTGSGSLLLRIQFIGSNLSPQAQTDSSNEAMAQYTLDAKFRNLLYQLVRDDEYNSFLRSWASNTKFTNVRIRIQDKSKNVTIIPAHRVFLAAQSDALGGYLRPNEELVILEGFQHFTVLVMLDYIYSGEIHCNDFTTIVHLAELGDKLKVYGLKDKCIRDIVMLFNSPVTNVKHIVACYKLGEMTRASSLMDKAIECFRVMKLCDKCIDFPNAKALMLLAGCDTDEEFNKILNLLYEKSCPVKENVSNLVQYPADEVKLVGTSSENWTGYIYVIPGELCKMMADACLTENSTIPGELSFIQQLEMENGFFELLKNSGGGVTLRVTSTSDANEASSKENRDLDKMLESLGISRSDYLSVVADSIGMTLKASLFDAEGRIVTANVTRGMLVDDNNYFWEVNSFVTPSIVAAWDGSSEMLLRISFGAQQLHPTFRVLSQNDERYQHFRKFDAAFLKKVNTEPFISRILSLFEQGTDSDVTVNVVDDKKVIAFHSPVHAVILSAMSAHFEKRFTMSPTLEIEAGRYSVETIQTLLKFVYGEDIAPGHIGLVLELISAGEEFEVKGLRDKCIDKLCSCQLNLETCIHLYEIGSGTQSMPLKDIAIKFFRRNRAAVDKFQEFKDLIHRHPRMLDLLNIS